MTRIVFSRPRFFNGRLLTAQDLEAEQAYHRDKAQFRNIQLYGTGIVSGLHIGLDQDRSSLIVSPGYAIDTYGRDICVPSDTSIPIPPESKGLSVWIRYVEMESAPVPGLSSSTAPENPVVNSCLEEGFELAFNVLPRRTGGRQPAPLPPPNQPDEWLLLGVLLRKGTAWRLDPTRRRVQKKSPSQQATRRS